MKAPLLTTLALAVSVNAFAAETTHVYEGKGNIYKTHATLADLRTVETELNKDTNGNSVALKIHDGQIKDLQANKADKTEVSAVNRRVDVVAVQANANTQNIKSVTERTTNNTKAIQDHETRINNNTIKGESLEYATKDLQKRATQTDYTLNEYGSKLDSYGSAHDALASNMAQYQNRTDSRLDTLESDVRQAKEAAAVALAVAGHQFCTDLDCGVQAAVSGSTIAGKQALAVGVGGAVSENLFFNAAFSQSGSTRGGVVSATYRLK